MNNRKILEDVYRDFFESDIKLEEKENKSNSENIPTLDNVFITEESKILLNKIVKYMIDYNKENEKNYLTFNVAIRSSDKTTIDSVINYLYYYSKENNYIDSNNNKKVSLYEIEKENDINEIYNNNGFICINDLDAINMNDPAFLKKFFNNFISRLNDKKITIISSNDVKGFLLNDKTLEDMFSFVIEEEKPQVSDIYNIVLEKINNMNLDISVKLLDYISNTYPNYDDTYTNYIDKLFKYITFNKDVPQEEKVKTNEELFKELDELVGLKKVKESFKDLVNLITLKNKTKEDLKINDINLHMVFLGNPGTGKTTVARLVSNILYNLKYIKQNKLIEVTAKDLIAEYVGQTSIKTKNVIEKALGGVLFIDEAYQLSTKDNQNSYNADAIATLIKEMEDKRDDLVVIFAGYTKEMNDFLDSNSGIVSRIGYTLTFDDYTTKELIDIFKVFSNKAGFILEDDALKELEKIIDENRNMKNFGNARFVRNVFEKTIINHAKNTKNNKNKTILKTITKKDITI